MSRAQVALLVSAGVTLALYLVPEGRYAIYPFYLLSTFVHELGHGLTAVLVGGEFDSLKVWSDGSGVATTRVIDGWRRAAVPAGGLVGPALAAVLCFWAARRPSTARWGFGIFGLFCLFTCLWVVRNGVGWLVAGTTGALCLAIGRFAHDELCRGLLAFLAIQLGLSVFSRGDYLFTDEAITGSGVGQSDVATIADALWLPYWFWGAVIAVLSVGIVAVGLYGYLRRTD